MLTIRFSRVGKKNHAQYRVVLAEKSFPVKGKFIEILGSYDPHSKEARLKSERINYWLEKGAGCSDSIFNLLVKEGIVKGKKRRINLAIKKKEGQKDEKGEEKKENDKDDVKEKEEEKEVQEKTEENIEKSEENKETDK